MIALINVICNQSLINIGAPSWLTKSRVVMYLILSLAVCMHNTVHLLPLAMLQYNDQVVFNSARTVACVGLL